MVKNFTKIGVRVATIAMVAAIAILHAQTPGLAANRSAAFTAKMKINTGCTVSANDLTFAPTTLLTGTELANATIAVTCSPGTFWFLSFSTTGFASSASGIMSGVTPGNLDKVNYTMNLLGFPFGFGTGSGQVTTLRGQITSTGSKTADNYVEARTIYVNY